MTKGKVTILEYTTKNPLEMIGTCSGVCWGANTDDKWKNIHRGLANLSSGHMRTAEYPQIYMVLDGYSARVIREFYTHIGGGPTRLQASTRYIDYDNFSYVTPLGLTPDQEQVYKETMDIIAINYKRLLDMGIKKEDVANILPLGMTTKVVVRTNLRNLIDMSHQRMCTRAYWEFRQLFNDIIKALNEYGDEWVEITENYFKPKCEVCGFCQEEKTCKRKPTKDQVDEFYKVGKLFLDEADNIIKREESGEDVFIDDMADAFENILNKL